MALESAIEQVTLNFKMQKTIRSMVLFSRKKNTRSMILFSRQIHEAFTRKSDVKKEWKNFKVSGISIFLLSVPIGTFCLGSWQVYRRKWKLKILEELENLTSHPPIPFPENADDIDNLEYRKVQIYGEFDHSREIYLGPRSKIVKGDISQMGGGLISSGQSGYIVITPFHLADKKITILVNRGWVSRKFMNPSQRMDGQVQGLVSLTGVVRKHEARAPFMPENQLKSNTFSYRDVIKMAEITGSAPIFVDAVESVEGGPIGGQTRVTLRNEHLSYLITWYSLSFLTSFLWYRKFILGKALM